MKGRFLKPRIHTVYPCTLQPAMSCTPRCSTPNPGHRQARRLHGFHCTGVRAFSRARSPKVFRFYFSNLPLTISNKLKRGHEILEFYESALQPKAVINIKYQVTKLTCISRRCAKIVDKLMTKQSVHVTHIHGLWLVKGRRFHDNRGFFEELYNECDSPNEMRVDKLRQVCSSQKYAMTNHHQTSLDSAAKYRCQQTKRAQGLTHVTLHEAREHFAGCGVRRSR